MSANHRIQFFLLVLGSFAVLASSVLFLQKKGVLGAFLDFTRA